MARQYRKKKDDRPELFLELLGELKNYNVSDVADATGIYKATLYFWLDGTTKCPKMPNIIKVADVLGMELTMKAKARHTKRRKRNA